jgi:hypothetical protein
MAIEELKEAKESQNDVKGLDRKTVFAIGQNP